MGMDFGWWHWKAGVLDLVDHRLDMAVDDLERNPHGFNEEQRTNAFRHWVMILIRNWDGHRKIK